MISVLLVEDNEVNQFIAVKTLKRCGVDVMVASHGQQALALIANKSFHLVLMDLDMPVMDGYESTRRIREKEDSYFKSVPIIAYTASEIDDAKGKAIQSGMNDFMTKPIQQNELKTTIERHVFGNMKNEYDVRPLAIDFNQYTDGDATFKKELASLMLADIVELQKSLAVANQLNDVDLFLKACHKAKTTLSMVNDNEFLMLVEGVKGKMAEGGNKTAIFTDQFRQFNRVSADLVKSFSKLIDECVEVPLN